MKARIFLIVILACAASLGAAQDLALPAPLTDLAGDPDRGRAVVRDQSKATCLICHRISQLPDRGQGGLGPALDGVGRVYGAAELRQRVMDARKISPDTIMPPYHSTEGLFRVGARWAGQTIYSAQDVEDVVAFLMTLRD